VSTAASCEWLVVLGLVLAIAVVELRSLHRDRKSRVEPDREPPDQDGPP
jgi:hypothetical protein